MPFPSVRGERRGHCHLGAEGWGAVTRSQEGGCREGLRVKETRKTSLSDLQVDHPAFQQEEVPAV